MIRGLLAEFGVDIPKGLERALRWHGRSSMAKHRMWIEAAKIVGTLSQQALDTHVGRSTAIWPSGYVATMLHVGS